MLLFDPRLDESKTSEHCSQLLFAPSYETLCYIHSEIRSSKLQTHSSQKTSLDAPPSVVLYLQKGERDHVVVLALLMRCQVIYLWITCLEQPPCAACIFFILFGVMSLSDCWCNSLSSRVCPHLLWAVGRVISILACPWVCWRWEWLIKQVWASTPILLHAKQELSSS